MIKLLAIYFWPLPPYVVFKYFEEELFLPRFPAQ